MSCIANVLKCKNFLHFFTRRNDLSNRSLYTSAPSYVIKIAMPSLSPTMSEGTIVAWVKKEGENINPGDVLCEIQTDKAVVALETEEEGVLARILMGNDSKDVKVGSLIGLIAEAGENWRNILVPSDVETKREESKPGKVNKTTHQSTTPEHSPTTKELSKGRKMGPAARLLLEKYGLSADTITLSNPRGYVLKEDVLNHVAERKLVPVASFAVIKSSATTGAVSLRQPSPSKVPDKGTSSVLDEQSYLDLDLSNVRRTIARRLSQSKREIPHAYNTISCNVDAILELRKKFKLEGIEFSINDVIIKAVGTALSLCPEMNVVWNGDQLRQLNSIDISVAVATDSGLITPIVTDVPLRGLHEISKIVRDLADRARRGKLQLHEFQGGSFTISNLGMFGIREFSAIINPPQCGILAVGGSHLRLDGDGRRTTLMNATLSYDGGAVSEHAAATFMVTFQQLLENPQSLIFGECVPKPWCKNDDAVAFL